MSEELRFTDRDEFRHWLSENAVSDEGVWLIFGKAGGPETLKASEALEEALCYGWIDGQMQKIDEKTDKKYFSQRRKTASGQRKTKRRLRAWRSGDS